MFGAMCHLYLGTGDGAFTGLYTFFVMADSSGCRQISLLSLNGHRLYTAELFVHPWWVCNGLSIREGGDR